MIRLSPMRRTSAISKRVGSAGSVTNEDTSAERIAELAARINQLLIDPPVFTLATAESCTGGNVAAALTSVPGSSAYFQGGIVSYSNAAKIALLGVPDEILARRGAVSAESACAMADGARLRLEADIAVSTTGIAGPDGGTVRKPVGTVFIALAEPDATTAFEHHFEGDRASIIRQSTIVALALIEQTARKVKTEDGRSD